jgi:hypothetical protein
MSTKISVKKMIPGKPIGIWTLAADFVDESWRVTIKVSTDQKWTYGPGNECECDADGHLSSSIDRNKCICPSAPVGALIGKFGGSTADISNTTPFAVGHFCVIEATDKQRGPLFLTINDELPGLHSNSGDLDVDIEIELIPAKIATGSPSPPRTPN